MKNYIELAEVFCLLILTSGCNQSLINYSRGVGIYPGNPVEDFSPALVVDNNYRNLAVHRAAYHSSGYDYNLTAQLVTDGIITSEKPDIINVSTQKGDLKKNEREWLFDGKSDSKYVINGSDIYIQLGISNDIPTVNKLSLVGSVTYQVDKSKDYKFVCLGSNDGDNWTVLGENSGSGLPGTERPPRQFRGPMPQIDPNAPQPSFKFNFAPPKPDRILNETFKFDKPVNYKFYRISCNASCAEDWSFTDWNFYSDENLLVLTPSLNFKSAWMSAGAGEEWVYVDLGTSCSFDHVKLYWINKASKGSVQASDDARNWITLTSLSDNGNLTDDIYLDKKAKGRYVRILMTESASKNNYILSELEVYGNGGVIPQPKASPELTNSRMYLNGGNWKIQRASEVSGNGESISKVGFASKDWIVATVPGTVLVSYWNAGALPDPNYSDNQLMISESFFASDFWYRNEFYIPANFKGEKMFLNFDGINWKSDVFINGKKLGKIEGAFIKGIFDVSDYILPGQRNSIAVLIKKNEHLGAIKEKTAISTDQNGGILGADNPTFHASIGWDWIPTIRGRNIGIWNDVYLNISSAVTLKDPFVLTDLALPDTTSADIYVDVTLQNHNNKAITGILTGKYGDIVFDQQVSLAPSELKVLRLNPSTNPALHFKNPKLWWPKGYGEPYLYNVELSFKTADGIVSDKTTFKSGVREMSFNEDNETLKLFINGRRFVGRGGNWGFSESNLNYRGREYDIAVAYHADMNFNMIRNWVGQIGDDEFYEACDRHGVMIWQDFWLANPGDGPNPYYPEMFMDNAKDMVKRIRNHPSIALYVGRNEGNPPAIIDESLRKVLPELHPGIHYISNSASGVVSGGGPYRALPVRDYFLLYGKDKFHSERGMPNVMTYESLKQMLPESKIWPQNSQWGMHDYTLQGAQSASSFNEIIEKGFGKIDDAKKFTELAQWINYNGYRGMFEGRSEFRKGLLLWMSHPAWPSMVWQTYDYYLEPTAAYFGCKKASEPIHIQWNPVYDDIEIVNYSARNKKNLSAKAQLINMDGSVQWEKTTGLDSDEDTTIKCFKLLFPESLSKVYFIKLTLKEENQIISENFYWRGLEDGNYQALNDLPVVKIESNTTVKKEGEDWLLTTTIKNPTATPALMIRVKVVGDKDHNRILPVFYSDNYIFLMPGEEKSITMKLKNADTRGEKPIVEIAGFNIL